MAVKLTLQAGPHERMNCPTLATVDLEGLDPARLVAKPDCCYGVLPCQVGPAGGASQVACMFPCLAAGEERAVSLEEGSSPSIEGVRLRQVGEDSTVRIYMEGDLFSVFHHGETWARPFLHPLIGPFGDPVTRAYPVVRDVPGETQDHPHHKSFWVAWGDVNGADNWSENEQGHARMVVRGLTAVESGPVFGRLGCALDWISETGAKLLQEDREFVFWNAPASGRLVDLTVRLRATQGEVTFGDTKEGGICSIRTASSMDAKADGTIVNSFGGINEAETWGKRAHWCDYYGPVNGKTVGIAIFDHPSNLRHPTYWHVRDYGLMTANPFGLSHFLRDPTVDGCYRLAAGEVLTFRYRIYVHAGDTEAGKVADKYHDYINPPTLRPG